MIGLLELSVYFHDCHVFALYSTRIANVIDLCNIIIYHHIIIILLQIYFSFVFVCLVYQCGGAIKITLHIILIFF